MPLRLDHLLPRRAVPKPDLGSGLPELWTITTFTHQFEFTNADLQGRSWRMRNAGDRDPRPVLTCSLCGKSQHDVSDLDGGPAAFVREFICDESVRVGQIGEPDTRLIAKPGSFP